MAENVSRISTPLYALSEMALYLDVPATTLARWSKQLTPTGAHLITHREGQARFEASVPFIGLAEAYVVASFRKHTKRLKMPYVLEVLAKLEAGLEGLETGVAHALASDRLALHGHQMLVNLSKDPEVAQYVEVLTENRVFDKVVEGHLTYLTYAGDGLAERFVLPDTPEPLLEMTPRKSYGQPVYIGKWARMQDVMDRWHAREHPRSIAANFELTEAEVLDTVRAFSKRAFPEAA